MKFAFLFPGQGSQSVGMLASLAAAEPLFEITLKEASQVLGWDLARLVREGPEEELNRTERTQPALLAASVAIHRVWRAHEGLQPALLAGHSLGEYSALVVAGALDFADALKLVELRGRLMQDAVPPGVGGMAAVLGMDDEAIAALCQRYPGDGVLAPVNYNAPGQVVVAGHRAALEWLLSEGKAAGAKKIVPLSVSVPSHCALMSEAAVQLQEYLAQVPIRAPQIPVLHNLDAQPRSEPESIRIALTAQLHHPVQWTRTVRQLVAAGAEALVECGPGKVLATLNKRILAEPSPRLQLTTEDPQSLFTALQTVSSSPIPA